MLSGTITALRVAATFPERQPQKQAALGPSDEDIRHRAYEIFLERGALPGGEIDDWLRAERELKKIAAYHRSRRVSAVGAS